MISDGIHHPMDPGWMDHHRIIDLQGFPVNKSNKFMLFMLYFFSSRGWRNLWFVCHASMTAGLKR